MLIVIYLFAFLKYLDYNVGSLILTRIHEAIKNHQASNE